MAITSIVLGCTATILGIWYAALGVSAIKYLSGANELDKVAGWTLWWCLDTEKYETEGKRLCKKGQLVAFSSVALWIVVFNVK